MEVGLLQSMRSVIKEKLTLGYISFAEYMQMVLYHPKYGYYTTKNKVIGIEGDFYTSANVGTVFGETIAEKFVKEAVNKDLHNILEYAAGEGKIALAIINYLVQFYPQIYEKLTYYIIEISPQMRDKQKLALSPHMDKVKWIDNIAKIKPFKGLVFANELLDAMPVHVLKYFKGGLLELYISLKGGKIHKAYLPCSNEVNNNAELIPELPTGSVLDFCTDAITWLQEIYDNSSDVVIYIIDYGYTIERKRSLQRRNRSTIRCFKNHKIYNNPLAEMGQRDITADVDFTTLAKAAKSFGFNTCKLENQGKFILQSGLYEKLVSNKAEFIQDKVLESKMHSLKQLVFPGAMGEAFEVLQLTKDFKK